LHNKVPARYLLGGIPEAHDIIKAVEQPDVFTASRLGELLAELRGAGAPGIAECQKAFMVDVVPPKYAPFNVGLAPLLEFLREKHGKQPNAWAPKPDISEFIRRQYKDTLAPPGSRCTRTTPRRRTCFSGIKKTGRASYRRRTACRPVRVVCPCPMRSTAPLTR
jgi:hypothetical protein